MDISQFIANGGIIGAIGGIMYWLNNKRLDRLENGKVNKETYDVQYIGIKDDMLTIHSKQEHANGILADIQRSIVRIETLMNVDMED